MPVSKHSALRRGTHLMSDRQTPIFNSHLAKGFLPAYIGFSQRILERVRIELHPGRIRFWHRGSGLPFLQRNALNEGE